MKLLLTSGGIRNDSIHSALLDLLGKPIAQSNALAIPTASYGHPNVHPVNAFVFVSGQEPRPMTTLGWNWVGLLELTALPSLGSDRWHSWIRDADVFLVDGGDALYLRYWIEESGLAAMFPALDDKVWVGVSAGSMVMTPRIGSSFVNWQQPGGGDRTLGVVDFSIFPHLDNPDLPDNTMEAAHQWAAEIGGPAYVIDDQTAIKVVDGDVEVVSEGHWTLLNA